MTHPRRSLLVRLLRSLPLLLLAAPAAATTFVRMSDAALADAATVIALVRVDDVQPSAPGSAPGSPPATLYRATIVRQLKGEAVGSSLVVRVPGGEGADGLSLRIPGAPEFRTGDRPLLFLAPRPDGTYAIVQLLLGAFPTEEVSGRRIAMQNLAGALEMPLPGRPRAATPGEDRPRDLDRFAAWLADRAAGVTRPADYWVDLPAGARRNLTGKFTLIASRQRHIRWFAFDRGESVPFVAHPSGQPGLADGGFDELQRALAAWNDEPHTDIQYRYAGTSITNASFAYDDGINSVLWDDPYGELFFPFDCKEGGILAASTPWIRSSSTATFQGETMTEIVAGDIVTNKNLECFFQSFPSDQASLVAQEILAHELGHTLGLNHSCGDLDSPPCNTDPVKDDALMRAYAHADGRGPRLGADDVAALRYLYDPSPRTLTPCRPGANVLCLDGRRFQVELSWFNFFDGSQGLGRAIPATDATGYFSFGDPGNIELLVKVLDFGGPVKVFYGELTDLLFTLRVTDTRTGTIKEYYNTPGDCGAIDQSYYDRAPGSALPARIAGIAGLLDPRRGSSGGCRPDKTTLCLLDGRFAVHVQWRNPFDGSSGDGGPSPLSNFVGTFYFTDRNNVELMVKLLPFPDRISLFYGALTDFDYTVEVEDLATGRIKDYRSTPGRLCGGIDNAAF